MKSLALFTVYLKNFIGRQKILDYYFYNIFQTLNEPRPFPFPKAQWPNPHPVLRRRNVEWSECYQLTSLNNDKNSYQAEPSASKLDIKWADLSVSEATKYGAAVLEQAGVGEAELNMKYIIGRALGFGASLSEVSFHHSALLGSLDFDETLLKSMCRRRLNREPLQYIYGDWDFHSITLKLRPPVLIPRPETEELVELVLGELRKMKSTDHGPSNARILDVGCGSGAIGLAILNALPDVECFAIDKNPEAVSLSLENAKLLGFQDRYQAECISIQDLNTDEDFDLIVSNPPYIPLKDMAGLQDEVIKYEDFDALCGGEDGTNIIREILLKAPQALKKNSLQQIWMEVDSSHPKMMRQWLSQTSQVDRRIQVVQWLKDFAGNPRFVMFKIGSDWSDQLEC